MGCNSGMLVDNTSLKSGRHHKHIFTGAGKYDNEREVGIVATELTTVNTSTNGPNRQRIKLMSV